MLLARLHAAEHAPADVVDDVVGLPVAVIVQV
jgi:hypothetical protein